MATTRGIVFVVHQLSPVRNVAARIASDAACTPARMSGFAEAAASIDGPDVILTDEIAIGADPVGFRKVRSRFPDAVILALVAPFRRRSGPLDGVQCTIEKPIEEKHLLLAFEWALEIRDAIRCVGPDA